MAKQNLGGVYALMEFPDYQYREFPKHIKVGPHGQYEVANNPKEETEIRARLQTENDNEVAFMEAAAEPKPDPLHESLIARAKKLGVPFNRKWSTAKLTAIIADAEKALDDLPPEENTEDGLATPSSDSASEDDESSESKDELIAHARTLGINANKLWGIPRLRREITEAEANLKG